MTEKQKRFCDFFVELGNAKEAAIKAGYSKKTAKQIGQENLTKPDLKDYINSRLSEMESKRIADAQEVLEYLTSVMRGEETETVATSKGLYEDVDVGAKDRLKAAELLGKRHALFTDKVDVAGTQKVIFVNDVPQDDDDG
ncbi:terminase small subunit [Enterococcus diestrammenae]|uniref:terminase small subunit n=1 Tax=Enterococcus diestrammenae TaxID=1155073 RepID=UPI00195872E0